MGHTLSMIGLLICVGTLIYVPVYIGIKIGRGRPIGPPPKGFWIAAWLGFGCALLGLAINVIQLP